MSSKKNKFLPKFEVLIILVFFASFLVWAVSKCGETRALYEDEESAEVAETTTPDIVANPDTVAAAATTALPLGNGTATTTNNNAPTTNPLRTTSNTQQSIRPIYVTIDGLNMRTGPSLDSAVVLKLKLFEEVNFLNEVTDSTEQISLGYEIADEPWFKVQHKRGHVGWVYGAGVDFYKKKRKGVIE